MLQVERAAMRRPPSGHFEWGRDRDILDAVSIHEDLWSWEPSIHINITQIINIGSGSITGNTVSRSV